MKETQSRNDSLDMETTTQLSNETFQVFAKALEQPIPSEAAVLIRHTPAWQKETKSGELDQN